MNKPLEGMKVAILATDMFEESELKQPKKVLENAGATTEIIAPKKPRILAAHHFDKAGTYHVGKLLSEADPADYDALLLPGGALNADAMRMEPAAQSFVQAFDTEDKPIAVICHAAWLLVSAGLVKGRTLTSYHTIADDIKNAGGTWMDEAVVRDANWVSSRQPDDIPAFNAEMLHLFAESQDNLTVGAATAPAGATAEPAFREQLTMEEPMTEEDLS